MSDNAEQILVVGPSWVGDMVMAQCLFKQLRADNPDAQIDVVAPAWSKGILGRMPEVRNTFTLSAAHGELAFGVRRKLGHSLRDIGYQRAITMPRSWKSALVPWFAKVPVRTGFRGEMRYGLLNDVRKLDKQQLDQTVKRFVTLGIPAGACLPEIPLPELEINPDNQQRLTETLQLNTRNKAVAFMPGAAYGPAKMWPLEYFSRLAAMLTREGIEVWVTGSDNEKQLGEEICRDAGKGALNLCGLTSLSDTPDLFAMADATVTNDSGLMHVAAASGSHVIPIYGSSSPDFTPPLTTNQSIQFLNLDCSPCFKRECPLQHLNCLKEISPELIFTATLKAIGHNSSNQAATEAN